MRFNTIIFGVALAAGCNGRTPVTVRFVDHAEAPPNRVDQPIEPRPQPDRPLDIVLGTRGADPMAPFVPRIVAKANGKIGLNVKDPEADLDVDADTITLRGPGTNVTLPTTTLDAKGPVTLKTDMTIKLGGRLLVKPPAHTWLAEGFEIDLYQTNGAPGPGPAGFNVGAYLSADHGAGPKPYVGFRSEGPNPEDVRLNLASPSVTTWRKQTDGSWWPTDVNFDSLERLSREQAAEIEKFKGEIAALKANRPRLVVAPTMVANGWQGQTALPWCVTAPCCSWRVESPCPPGYSVFSGGCELANTGWVPGRAIASLATNGPNAAGKAWTCEARLKDHCVDVTLAARALCFSDSSIMVIR